MALRKSLHVRALGSTHSFGIDQFKKSAEAPVKLVDLTTNFGQAGVRQWISNPSVKGLFLAPPCGTCSLARSIILRDKFGRRINAPKPLRSEYYPEGLPHLSARDRLRVSAANKLYSFVQDVVEIAIDRNIPVVVENPRSSLYWQTGITPSAQVGRLSGSRSDIGFQLTQFPGEGRKVREPHGERSKKL